MIERTRCPAGDTLSAWFDGEIGAPWHQAIETHLVGCPRCRAAVARLERLRERLAGDPWPVVRELPPLAAALPRPVPLWRRRLALPLPAVAAAGLAIAGLGLALAIQSARTALPWMSIKRGPTGTTELKVAAPVDDLEQLLNSLSQQARTREIVIQLPADSQLILMGQPQLMREADFSRGQR
jgi:anti-sigma factor RsiW